MPVPVIVSSRLTLRPLCAGDAEAVVAGVGNYDVSKWLSVVPYPYGLEDARDFIAKVTEGDKAVWAVTDAAGLVGTVSVEDELGYWIARPAWGRGYAFEAAHAAVTHWFADPDAPDLPSGYFHGNTRSGRILEALGFREIGVRKRTAKALSQDVDSHEMCLSRADWVAQQAFEVYTPRLVLRPLRLDDADRLRQLISPTLARNVASIEYGWDTEQARSYIAKRLWGGLPGFVLGIERDGQLIGGIGCGSTPLRLMYFLGEPHWGQGLASEAVSAFLPEVFRRFPVRHLKAAHFADNPASGAILRKHGFEHIAGTGHSRSPGRVDPAPTVEYRLCRDNLRTPV